MHHWNRRTTGFRTTVLVCAAVLLALAACASSPHTITITGSNTGTDVDTGTDDAEDNDTNVGTNADTKDDDIDDDTGINIDIHDDTTWQEVVDTLTASEQSCIRDEFGGVHEWAMRQAVIGENFTEQGEALVFSCLDLDTARGLFLLMLQAEFRQELGVEAEFDQDERQCLREWVANIDVEDMFEANAGDDLLRTSYFLEIVTCVPNSLVQAVATGVGVDAGELNDDERECLREWANNLDEDDMTTLINQEDDAAAASFGLGLLACVPDLLIEGIAAGMGVNAYELDDDERECLGEWIADLGEDDMTTLINQEDDAAAASLGLGLLACIPELLIGGMLEDAGQVVPSDECISNTDAVFGKDDHANGIKGATPIAVGEAAEGAIDYDVDLDFFVFKAEAGETYQVDVAPGTMWDPVVLLCHGDEKLAYNDDYDGLAPRITWVAPSAGSYFVKVVGWDEGTYTLTVEVR